MGMQFSKHGMARMNQRGFTKDDLELVRRYGSQINDSDAEVYFLRDKDVQKEIDRCKHEIQRLTHLRGSKVVIRNNELVTAVRSGRQHSKKLLGQAW